jgi:hypothetical protein
VLIAVYYNFHTTFGLLEVWILGNPNFIVRERFPLFPGSVQDRLPYTKTSNFIVRERFPLFPGSVDDRLPYTET